MKGFLAAILLALSATACGGAALTVDPTPRPEGERGQLLNPIDKARGTTNELNERQQGEYYGEQEYQGEFPGE